MVVEQGGPMESDWLCVCLQRKGQMLWVRHIDLNHGHAGEDDGTQKPDSDGDGQVPVKEQSVWDYVFPTTAEEMDKESIHGTDPRNNPYGGQATWYGGA
jgi:pectate lyase